MSVIPAGHGDCFLVQCGPFNILIDSGPSSAAIRLRAQELLKQALGQRQVIDLAIVTHYDDDHIGGMVHMLRDQTIKVEKLLFNSPRLINRCINEQNGEVRITAGDACEISDSLPPCNDSVISAGKQLAFFNNRVLLNMLSPLATDIVNLGTPMIARLREESRITNRHREPVVCPNRQELLNYHAPEKSDQSPANGLSLAFSLSFAGHKILFLGDSWPSRVSQSLQDAMVVDLVVVSHHGSQYNSTLELYEKIIASHYLVSTDGKRHPDIETFARIVKAAKGRDLMFYFSEASEELAAMFAATDLPRHFPTEGKPLTLEFPLPQGEMSNLAVMLQRCLAQAEQIAPQVKDSIYPIWYQDQHGTRRLVGTSFFAYLQNRLLLITAEHNFSDNQGKTLYITLGGSSRRLDAMKGKVSQNDDLWVAEVDEDITAAVVGKIPELQYRSSDALRRSLGVVFMGYQESMNTDLAQPQLLAISTMLEMRPLHSPSQLPQPIYNTLDSDYLYNINGEPLMITPEMYGMSGGPAFGWLCEPGADDRPPVFRYFLQGVSTNWSKSQGYVVACSAARIVALIDKDPDASN